MSFRPRCPAGLIRRPTNLVGATALLLTLMAMPAGGTTQNHANSNGAGDIHKIQHVVLLMQENRSFDTYLGHLKAYDPTIDTELEPNTGNPDPTNPTGPPVLPFHKSNYCEVADLDHSWNGTHKEWDNGAMDGFTAANAVAADPTGSRSMGYYTQAVLPYYYALYDTFAMGDRYFSSVLSQTFPNRFYSLAGTSFGHIANDFPPPTDPTAFGPPNGTIFQQLDAHHVSWHIYESEIPFAAEFGYVRANAAGHVFPISQYYAEAAAGTLPQVSFVDPIFLGPTNVENDEHPPSNVQVGERFASDVIHSLFTSPNWSTAALFLTYDEHGGFYDHVPPPAATPPDNIPPMLAPGDAPGGFNNYGIRVPVAVVSPYSRAHFVSHVVNDHTSILRFIETRFGLPALTNRDAAASPMLEFFNFSRPRFATPPSLPAAPIDPTQFAQCLSAPPNGAF
jgi:phospholipase C